MKHIDRILKKLKNYRGQRGAYKACCPAHEDKNPSLSITVGKDKRIRLKCWSANCTPASILKALSLSFSDLLPDPAEEVINADDQLTIDGLGIDSATNSAVSTEAASDLRSKVYNKLLQSLALSEQHRNDLRERGLSDSDIDERGYRSLTIKTGQNALAELCTTFSNEELLSVPGFVTNDESGTRIVGPQRGLVIPVRDLLGRIVALKVRRDDNNNKSGKYAAISGGGGPSCGTPTHVPLGTLGPLSIVRVTEGELKADIATALSEIPTIGIAGVSNWRPAITHLQSLSVQTVYLAFDADCQTKTHVAHQLGQFESTLRDAGFEVKIERWDLEDGKGIDDLLAAGKHPQLLENDIAANFLSAILSESAPPSVPEAVEKAAEPDVGGDSPHQPHSINKVLPFPLEIFPPPLQKFCRQVADTVGCPIDLVAVPTIVAAATAIGASRSIEAKAGWQESPRIYAASVAAPGSGKSPAESIVLKPLHRLQNRYRVNHQRAEMEFETGESSHAVPDTELLLECPANVADCTTQTAPMDQLSSLMEETGSDVAVESQPELDADGSIPDATFTAMQPTKPPVLRRVVVGDATTEALALILAENPRGVLMARDEISSWIRGMNQYRGGKGADRGFYLSCWSGELVSVDRKSSRQHVCVPKPFVNVLGGIQPDMLREFVDEEGRSDGFMDRIVFSFPDPVIPPGWTEQGVEESVEKYWCDTLNRLFTLKMEYVEAEDVYKPQVLNFAENAKLLWGDWFNEHNMEIHSLELAEALKGPWAKLRSYCLRFALVIQLIHSVSEECEGDYVSRNALSSAIDLVNYFKSHTRKVYASLKRDADDRKVEVVVKWLARRGGKCTARDLQRSGVAGIKKVTEAQKIMKDMHDRGIGDFVHQPEQKRTSPYFVMSPALPSGVR